MLCVGFRKKTFNWDKSDLDLILVEGDSFTKVWAHLICSHIWYGRLQTQLAALTIMDSFLRDVVTENAGTKLCLLFMESFTTTIILSRNCYYLFNSQIYDKRISGYSGWYLRLTSQDTGTIEEGLGKDYHWAFPSAQLKTIC